ncbi:MAG: hypothetical protein WCK11_03380 [Candidatus Falkowbacteria bacterium]
MTENNSPLQVLVICTHQKLSRLIQVDEEVAKAVAAAKSKGINIDFPNSVAAVLEKTTFSPNHRVLSLIIHDDDDPTRVQAYRPYRDVVRKAKKAGGNGELATWDESLVHPGELFDFIKSRLLSDIKQLRSKAKQPRKH